MPRNKIIENLLLLPLAKIYGAVTAMRNTMFKWGILKQRTFPVPVVVVGNIAVGGTGKTPHTEYIIEILKYEYNIGVLSRGYKRKTSGFVMASRHSTPIDIGDEPYQIYQKFGSQVMVAVCEDRCKGIDEMLKINPKINLVLLDDAFQHQYVKPSVAIVLTEFNRPVFFDKMLPLGRLRESAKAIYRADMVVVTKCPEQLKPLEYRIFKNNLKLYPYQKLFFSRYKYGVLTPLFPDDVTHIPYLDYMGEDDRILVVSGIANPRPFVRYVKRHRPLVKVKIFPDHHNFTRKDLDGIVRKFEDIKAKNKCIITTEKDAVRLATNPYFPPHLKAVTFYLPISVTFDTNSGESFDVELKKMIARSKTL